VLAAMLLSMFAAPFLVERSGELARRWSASDWMHRAMELHNIAVQSMNADQHVVICGYGRTGQNLARLLEKDRYLSIDVDPSIQEAVPAGRAVVSVTPPGGDEHPPAAAAKADHHFGSDGFLEILGSTFRAGWEMAERAGQVLTGSAVAANDDVLSRRHRLHRDVMQFHRAMASPCEALQRRASRRLRSTRNGAANIGTAAWRPAPAGRSRAQHIEGRPLAASSTKRTRLAASASPVRRATAVGWLE